MFNVLLTIPHLFLLALGSFFLLLTIRRLLIKRPLFIFLYHLFLFIGLYIAAIGGGGVQNEGYRRLEEFIELEKNNELEKAKNNLHLYDRMLQIDLQEFKNSIEFREYLKQHDASVDRAEAITIGWIFVLLAELSGIVIFFMRVIL